MYTETVDFLNEAGIAKPSIGLVLGSGLGDLAKEIENAVIIPYKNIPNFPLSTVEGHEGSLIYGDLAGKKVIALQGRFHFYEGYDIQTVTYPIRIFNELGVKHLIVTNAAGGVNQRFKPGDLMIITDHINLNGINPLIGENNKEHGPRFVDMSQPYSKKACTILKAIAATEGYKLKTGVYYWMTGPSYETKAEINAIRTLGGDAVGMSTVPEVVVANHCGMEVVGISCITNLAAGMQAELNHEEVVETSSKVNERFKNLIKEYLFKL